MKNRGTQKLLSLLKHLISRGTRVGFRIMIKRRQLRRSSSNSRSRSSSWERSANIQLGFGFLHSSFQDLSLQKRHWMDDDAEIKKENRFFFFDENISNFYLFAKVWIEKSTMEVEWKWNANWTEQLTSKLSECGTEQCKILINIIWWFGACYRTE